MKFSSKTHDTLTNFMEAQNFTVTRHICGLDTAWRAEWSFGVGGRTLGINSEMDALPGIGHAYVLLVFNFLLLRLMH